MPELLSFDLAIFLCGTVAAAFVTGLSGFAFGMVAAAIWFYALPPPQASALIAAYALIVQGYAVSPKGDSGRSALGPGSAHLLGSAP